MGRLTLTREPVAWVDRLRAYTVLVDGVAVAKIRRGETIDIQLPSRLVRVQMKIDWAMSQELQIDGRQDVALTCRANASPGKVLFWITVWRKNYISLKQV